MQTVHRESGFVAITTVLVVAAVVLMISVSVSLLGIGQGQSGLALFLGEDALHRTEGCVEDALLKLRASSSYAGGSITRPEGTCSVTVTNTPPSTTYTLTVTTTDTKYRRTVQVVAVRASTIAITSWTEL